MQDDLQITEAQAVYLEKFLNFQGSIAAFAAAMDIPLVDMIDILSAPPTKQRLKSAAKLTKLRRKIIITEIEITALKTLEQIAKNPLTPLLERRRAASSILRAIHKPKPRRYRYPPTPRPPSPPPNNPPPPPEDLDDFDDPAGSDDRATDLLYSTGLWPPPNSPPSQNRARKEVGLPSAPNPIPLPTLVAQASSPVSPRPTYLLPNPTSPPGATTRRAAAQLWKCSPDIPNSEQHAQSQINDQTHSLALGAPFCEFDGSWFDERTTTIAHSGALGIKPRAPPRASARGLLAVGLPGLGMGDGFTSTFQLRAQPARHGCCGSKGNGTSHRQDAYATGGNQRNTS